MTDAPKPMKKIAKKKSETKKVQWARPFVIELKVVFEDPNRRVTVDDLHVAADYAADAAREALEACSPPYKVAEVEVEATYSYQQSKHRSKR